MVSNSSGPLHRAGVGFVGVGVVHRRRDASVELADGRRGGAPRRPLRPPLPAPRRPTLRPRRTGATTFYRVLPGFTEFYWVLTKFLLGFIVLNLVLLGFTELYWVLTKFLLGFIVLNLVLLGFTEFYWVLTKFLLGFIVLNLVLLGFTEFY